MPRDSCFPNERFVQEALEAHFLSRGFVAGRKGYTDLVVDHPESGERWLIEAKGDTSAVGLDFRTGLGQLLQTMDEETALYGLGVPDTPAFRRQMDATPTRIRGILGFYWLVVGEDASVRVEGPPEWRS